MLWAWTGSGSRPDAHRSTGASRAEDRQTGRMAADVPQRVARFEPLDIRPGLSQGVAWLLAKGARGSLWMTAAHAVDACLEIHLDPIAAPPRRAELLPPRSDLPNSDLAVIRVQGMIPPGSPLRVADGPLPPEALLAALDWRVDERRGAMIAFPVEPVESVTARLVGGDFPAVAIAVPAGVARVGQSGSPLLDGHGHVVGVLFGVPDAERDGARLGFAHRGQDVATIARAYGVPTVSGSPRPARYDQAESFLQDLDGRILPLLCRR